MRVGGVCFYVMLFLCGFVFLFSCFYFFGMKNYSESLFRIRVLGFLFKFSGLEFLEGRFGGTWIEYTF